MQDAIATLTRQLNAAEKDKAEAEAHSASLTAKVAEAEKADERLRVAQRSMAAMCVFRIILLQMYCPDDGFIVEVLSIEPHVFLMIIGKAKSAIFKISYSDKCVGIRSSTEHSCFQIFFKYILYSQ